MEKVFCFFWKFIKEEGVTNLIYSEKDFFENWSIIFESTPKILGPGSGEPLFPILLFL